MAGSVSLPVGKITLKSVCWSKSDLLKIDTVECKYLELLRLTDRLVGLFSDRRFLCLSLLLCAFGSTNWFRMLSF